MERNPTLGAVGMCAILVLSGCSGYMAETGGPNFNPDAVHVGVTREEVELQLGAPVSSRTLPSGGREDTYKYKERSPDPFLGSLYFALAALTLGGWDLIGVPLELSRGEERYITVTYSGDDQVTTIQWHPPGLP